MGVRRNAHGMWSAHHRRRQLMPPSLTALRVLLLALLCGGLCLMAPQRAHAGGTCGGTAPSCSGSCLPGSVCAGAAGSPCLCLQTCGDFPSCGPGVCPTGFVCTTGPTECFCSPVATATPTITPTLAPTLTPTNTAPSNPVPATSTSGLALGWLVLAAVGGISLVRRRSSRPR
jgi:hypothetical protein